MNIYNWIYLSPPRRQTIILYIIVKVYSLPIDQHKNHTIPFYAIFFRLFIFTTGINSLFSVFVNFHKKQVIPLGRLDMCKQPNTLPTWPWGPGGNKLMKSTLCSTYYLNHDDTAYSFERRLYNCLNEI